MRTRARRSVAALVALFAMLASLALPAATLPMRAFPGDLCVGGKRVPAAPAPAVHAHDCDACCASTPTALPGPGTSPPVVAYAPVRVVAPVARTRDADRAQLPHARAPPVS
jgi:hypothetical protein